MPGRLTIVTRIKSPLIFLCFFYSLKKALAPKLGGSQAHPGFAVSVVNDLE